MQSLCIQQISVTCISQWLLENISESVQSCPSFIHPLVSDHHSQYCSPTSSHPILLLVEIIFQDDFITYFPTERLPKSLHFGAFFIVIMLRSLAAPFSLSQEYLLTCVLFSFIVLLFSLQGPISALRLISCKSFSLRHQSDSFFISEIISVEHINSGDPLRCIFPCLEFFFNVYQL